MGFAVLGRRKTGDGFELPDKVRGILISQRKGNLRDTAVFKQQHILGGIDPRFD